MARFASDVEIAAYLAEQKVLPRDYGTKLARFKPKRQHREADLTVIGAAGNEYRIILRQNALDPLNFSAILALAPVSSYDVFRLRRYNGRAHEHTNPIEQDRFFDFHMHIATERYQDIGQKEDTFAVPTDRFSSLDSAIRCLLQDGGFVPPEDDNLVLFANLQT